MATGDQDYSKGAAVSVERYQEPQQSAIDIVDGAFSVEKMRRQINLIQELMRDSMREGEHYGAIPGTEKKCPECDGKKEINGAQCPKCKGKGKWAKPSLLKSGAEKLNFIFRLSQKFLVEIEAIPPEQANGIRGHREYRVHGDVYHIPTGAHLGQGVGSCSTMESKYRFRTGPTESTGNPVPKEYWDCRDSDPKKAQSFLGGPGFVPKKGESGKWEIFIRGEKVENDNPADVYNTVLKMAKKRCMVDGDLTVTAASDIFTQDVEELVDNGVIVPAAPPAPAAAPPPAQAPTVAPPATGKEPEKDIQTLRSELDELGQIAVDAGIYRELGDAIQSFTSTEKFQSKCRFSGGLTKEWQIKKALDKANAVLNSLPARVDSGDDQDIPM